MLKRYLFRTLGTLFVSFFMSTNVFAAEIDRLFNCEQLQNLQSAEIKNCFIGTWKLVVNIKNEGNVITYPFGKDAVGYITYGDDGYMSVQMMQANRKTIFPGYFAYFGKYTIDPVNHLIHHFLDGSLNPNDVGQDRVRRYQFNGNQLHLVPIEESNREIIWDKMAN